MYAPLTLETSSGPVVLRSERDDDRTFLFALFRSHASAELVALPVDEATRDAVAQMQFNSATATYRAQFADARFDIIERDGERIGRLITDPGGETACMVDYALMPDRRGAGLGGSIIAAVLVQLAPRDRPMRVKVLMTNIPSLRMCIRLGFRQVNDDMPMLQLEWRPSGLSDPLA